MSAKPVTVEAEEAKAIANGSTHAANDTFIDTSQVAIALFADKDSFSAVIAVNLLELLQISKALRQQGEGIMDKDTVLAKVGDAASAIVGDAVKLGIDLGKLAGMSVTAIGTTTGEIFSGSARIDTSQINKLLGSVRKMQSKYCTFKNERYFSEISLYLNDFFLLGQRLGSFVNNTVYSLKSIEKNGIGILNASGSPGGYLKNRWTNFVGMWERQFIELGEMFIAEGGIDLSPICNTLNTMIASLQDFVGIQQDILFTINAVIQLVQGFVKQLLGIIEKIKQLVSAAFTAGALIGIIAVSLISVSALEKLLRGLLKKLKGSIPPATLRKISILLDTLDTNTRNAVLNGDITKILGDNKGQAVIGELDKDLEVLRRASLGLYDIDYETTMAEFRRRYSSQFATISDAMRYIEWQKRDIRELTDMNSREIEFDPFVSTGQILKEQRDKKLEYNKKLDLFCRYYESKLCELKKNEGS